MPVKPASDPVKPELSPAAAETQRRNTLITQGAELAAGLLWNDRRSLPLLYCLLILPGAWGAYFELSGASFGVWFTLIQRGLQLVFLFLVYSRWVSRLRNAPYAVEARPLLLTLGLGYVFWFLFVIPVLMQFVPAVSQVRILFVALLIPAALFALRYFFYPLPAVLGISPLRRLLAQAHAIGQGSLSFPIRAMLGPIGAMSLLSALAIAPHPDGRDVLVNVFSELVDGVFWLLSSYLALGISLRALDDPTWSSFKLDPYRNARFSTLEVQGPKWLSKLLSPRHGLIMLGISLFLWAGNYVRYVETPPAAKFVLNSVTAAGSTVTVDLNALDERYKFRGFLPANFALAGEKRAEIAPLPTKATLPPNPDDVRFRFPKDKPEVKLILEFQTKRPEESLRALEDLYLWYRNARLMKIKVAPAS